MYFFNYFHNLFLTYNQQTSSSVLRKISYVISIVIVLMGLWIYKPIHAQSAIFKGQIIQFKKVVQPSGATYLRGIFEGKKVLATTKKNLIKNNSNYLGTFRKLVKKDNSKPQLVTYHVFNR